jgi:hypothetical protein
MNLTEQGRCGKGFLEKPGQLDVRAPARIRRENDWNRGEVHMPLHFADKRDAVHRRHCAVGHEYVRADFQREPKCVATIGRRSNEMAFRCEK